jgi:hypothetical protein
MHRYVSQSFEATDRPFIFITLTLSPTRRSTTELAPHRNCCGPRQIVVELACRRLTLRDEFSPKVKDELAKRVGYLCSNPGCRQSTCGPQVADSGTVNIGVAAHISAASPAGPRYEVSLSVNERTSPDNGIWLCQVCGKLVDSDCNRYTKEKLKEWKTDAEAAAAKALEHRRASPYTGSEGVFLEAERLMPELIAEMRKDVRGDNSELIREFVILPNFSVAFMGTKERFEYYEGTYPKIQLQIDWLEEMGVVVDVTPNNAPIYRMVEEFARWLRGLS